MPLMQIRCLARQRVTRFAAGMLNTKTGQKSGLVLLITGSIAADCGGQKEDFGGKEICRARGHPCLPIKTSGMGHYCNKPFWIT
jgi:hypothetical protein